jgi:hypothetical protein
MTLQEGHRSDHSLKVKVANQEVRPKTGPEGIVSQECQGSSPVHCQVGAIDSVLSSSMVSR